MDHSPGSDTRGAVEELSQIWMGVGSCVTESNAYEHKEWKFRIVINNELKSRGEIKKT